MALFSTPGPVRSRDPKRGESLTRGRCRKEIRPSTGVPARGAATARADSDMLRSRSGPLVNARAGSAPSLRPRTPRLDARACPDRHDRLTAQLAPGSSARRGCAAAPRLTPGVERLPSHLSLTLPPATPIQAFAGSFRARRSIVQEASDVPRHPHARHRSRDRTGRALRDPLVRARLCRGPAARLVLRAQACREDDRLWSPAQARPTPCSSTTSSSTRRSAWCWEGGWATCWSTGYPTTCRTRWRSFRSGGAAWRSMAGWSA